jgi:UDP-N-acetylglucosamine 2-epimerase (non-hydrolysing)
MINCILGTRAQLIKMVPLIKRIEEKGWDINLIHTGQHFQNMQETCVEFGLQSEWHPLYAGAEVNTVPQALKWFGCLLLQAILKPSKILRRSAPQQDIVLVHGDTFSTVLGALIGKRAGMPVAHIESGLRSFNIWHPFPEELSRLVTFRLIDLAFCPGRWACDNLRGYPAIKKIDTGSNTLLDTLRLAQRINQQTAKPIRQAPYAICSIHRFENIYQQANFAHIITLLELASQTCPLVFVLHPTTKKRLLKTGLMDILNKLPNIELTERMGYADFVHLLTHSRFVITDGGSNQEELAYLGVPTLLMRKATERQEGLGANTVISDFSEETIQNFLDNLDRYRVKTNPIEPSPCDIILAELEKFA